MILELIGMFSAAAVPAMTVSAAASSIVGIVNQTDEYISDMYPPEVFDDTEYYIHHITMSEKDAKELGLSETQYTLSWSEQELGRYINHENWIFSGTGDRLKSRREIRKLIRTGQTRARQMMQGG